MTPVSDRPPIAGLITVSVVIPAHNEENSIRAALESLLPLRPDEEILVIDDHSTDGTVEAALSLGIERIRVISAVGRGLVDALNQGIDQARGEFIARADADDRSLPGRLQHQREILERTGADLCAGPALLVRPDGVEVGRFSPCLCDGTWPFVFLVGSAMAHGSVMVRRAAVRAVGGYHRSAYPAEDYDLWVRLLASGHRFASSQQPVYEYLINPTGISATLRAEQRQAHDRVALCARETLPDVRFSTSHLVRLAFGEQVAGGRVYRRNFAKVLINSRRRVTHLTFRERLAIALALPFIDPAYIAKVYWSRGVARIRLR